jgi:glycerol-3-phosphate acyltransferase PlsY
MWESVIIAAGYFVGSVSTAIIVCKLMGLPDPRTQGSRNPGATNVLRLGGKKAAAVTLIGDFAKGLLPVIIARLLDMDVLTLGLVGLAAFLGHLFPVFFAFRGGKGVATALGVLTGLVWQLGVAALITWLVVAKVFRISSLSALVATALTPVYAWWLQVPGTLMYIIVPMCLLVLVRHHQNIRNLISGHEGRISDR